MKKSPFAAAALVVLVCSVLVGMFWESRFLTLIKENLAYGDPLYSLFYIGGFIFFCYFCTLTVKSVLKKN